MNSIATPHPIARPALPRGAIMLSLAALTIAAVIFESGAMTRPAPVVAPAPVLPIAQALLEQAPPAAGPAVDWTRVADANITPAETVGAYDR